MTYSLQGWGNILLLFDPHSVSPINLLSVNQSSIDIHKDHLPRSLEILVSNNSSKSHICISYRGEQHKAIIEAEQFVVETEIVNLRTWNRIKVFCISFQILYQGTENSKSCNQEWEYHEILASFKSIFPICCLNSFPRILAKIHLIMMMVVRETVITVLRARQCLHTLDTHPLLHVVLMSILRYVINSDS